MQERQTEKKWEKTKVQFLLRNSHSGLYYARLFVGGKEVWKSLKTDVFSVARAKLPGLLSEVRQVQKPLSSVKTGIVTVENAAAAYLESIRRRVNIKAPTKHYWEQIEKALRDSCPDLLEKKLNASTEDDWHNWASTYASAASPTRYNNTVDLLRGVFELGIKEGLIFRNPAAGLGKLKVGSKHLELPSREQFAALVKAIRTNGAWCSRGCADLVEFLAYSGMRLGEAEHVTWNDIDMENGFLWIHGDPETGTKNSERRQVPIIPALERLLADLRQNPRAVRDEKRRDGNYVLAITEAQKAIDSACTKLGLKRITHHDLRHLFATQCIESGVDIPTVSKWLGHKDGGALAMKTYGHLRRDHFRAAAQKVQF